MAKPTPKPISPEEVREKALEVLNGCPFPYLATVDSDRPRVRPVSPVRYEGFVVYVANLRHYNKTKEIGINPHVELCYMDKTHNQVRITGTAEVVGERAVLESIWKENTLLRQFLGDIDNPQLVVYRIQPSQVRFMQEWAMEYMEVPIDLN